MEEKLSRLERLISRSIADSLLGASGRLSSNESIARQLTQEIAACTRVDSHNRNYAPDQYTLSLNPFDFEDLQLRASHTQSILSKILRKALEGVDFIVVRDPHITLATDPTLRRNEVRVIAWHGTDPLQFTKEIDEKKIEDFNRPPAGAFLLIEGKRYFPLTEQMIKIGRRLDNHLILEDRHVSRTHARLEVVGGHYVITDLNSTAGTRINGRLATRHTLRPGDIISIAAIQMIYGEDPSGPPEATPIYKPPPATDSETDKITPLDLHFKFEKTTSPYAKK
jgi:hypothetical protein